MFLSTVRELLWLSYLFYDFQLAVPLPIHVHCDNLAAVHITNNLVFHEYTKHLATTIIKMSSALEYKNSCAKYVASVATIFCDCNGLNVW